MKLIRFFKSKTFWLNFILAVIAVSLIFFGLKTWLDSYTRHGENIAVPDLIRLSYEEATSQLTALGLEAEILDTAEFNPKMPRGSIVDQYPPAAALVKTGREIKLTVNPMKPRKIELPDLVEKTKRRAIYDLESKGFVVGDLEYVPYIGKDVVVDVKIKGISVNPKQRFDKGTVVTLVLGRGLGDTRIAMPYLKWMQLGEAKNRLMEMGLNIGSITYDPEVVDSTAALIYQQYPQPSLTPNINAGISVDLWLTEDYTKIPNDSLAYQTNAIPDSTLQQSDADPEF
jgi:beta-lactam-binding protein with PASTA domain